MKLFILIQFEFYISKNIILIQLYIKKQGLQKKSVKKSEDPSEELF